MTIKYIVSNRKVDVKEAAKLLGLKAWTNPRDSKDIRFYLNRPELQKVCLDQTYYKTGNVRGCEYINENGETISIAHARAYGYFNKTYIDRNGIVWTNWSPYGYDYENFAEAVASNLNRMVGKHSEKTITDKAVKEVAMQKTAA